MKNYFKLITILIVFLCFNSYSQIKVDNYGKVGIGNTTPSYTLDVNGSFRFLSTYYDVIFQSGYLYSTSNAIIGKNNYRWYELYADSPTFTYEPDVDSDISYKKDVKEFTNTINQLMALRPVKYKLIDDKVRDNVFNPNIPDKENFGFIAQEMMEIFPDIVTTREDGRHGIRYGELIPVLVKAVQEQQTQIEELKKRIEMLEDKTK